MKYILKSYNLFVEIRDCKDFNSTSMLWVGIIVNDCCNIELNC